MLDFQYSIAILDYFLLLLPFCLYIHGFLIANVVALNLFASFLYRFCRLLYGFYIALCIVIALSTIAKENWIIECLDRIIIISHFGGIKNIIAIFTLQIYISECIKEAFFSYIIWNFVNRPVLIS